MDSSRCSSVASVDTIAPLNELRDWAAQAAAAAQENVDPLIARVERTPIAATVLMHLLRATEGISIESALIAESLAYSTLQAGPEFRAWLAANRSLAPAQHSDQGPAVIVERDGDSLRLALNRPSLRNAMTVEMRDALIEALNLVVDDGTIRDVEISGRGKCFSTGGDLTEFGSFPDPATAHIVRSLALPGRLLARCANRVRARLHGACVGSGMELPAFAHRVIATGDAWFQLPELEFGLIPGAGGCVSIPRRIGAARTAWMILSGKRIDARRAREWGLVDEIPK